MLLVFKILFLVFFVYAGIGRYLFSNSSRLMIKHSKRAVIESIIQALSLLLVLLALIAVLTDWIAYFDVVMPLWVSIVSMVGFALTTHLFVLTHKHLGNFWSPKLQIRTKHKLIKTGPYKYIRHPMYTSLFFWSLFQGLLIGNLLVLVAWCVGFVLLMCFRIRQEEALMIKEFKKDYKSYMGKTGCIFPLLKY